MNIPESKESSIASEAVAHLQRNGFTAYWAGGCVRDILMGNKPKDYDIATNALPDEIKELFPVSKEVGKAFGVMIVIIKGITLEVATFRKDGNYLDGRHPEKVTFCDAQTDAERRDFTINALFYDPITKELHDFTGGRDDIKKRIVRFVGESEERIREDHLRMLRAVRFASRPGFTLEERAKEMITSHSNLISKVSVERIRDELNSAFTDPQSAAGALSLLDELGLMTLILPEIASLKGCEQPPEFHPEGDVFIHTKLMLEIMDTWPNAQLAWSILLHDIGKPSVATKGSDRIRFNRHAEVGAQMAETVLKRLKFSNADSDAITFAVKNHMRFMEVKKMKRSTLRRMLSEPTFPLELELHRVDCKASHGKTDNYDFLLATIDEMAEEISLPKPIISGRDIMEMGVLKGPDVGRWHKQAYEAQLEDRFDSRKKLYQWLKQRIESECMSE